MENRLKITTATLAALSLTVAGCSLLEGTQATGSASCPTAFEGADTATIVIADGDADRSQAISQRRIEAVEEVLFNAAACGDAGIEVSVTRVRSLQDRDTLWTGNPYTFGETPVIAEKLTREELATVTPQIAAALATQQGSTASNTRFVAPEVVAETVRDDPGPVVVFGTGSPTRRDVAKVSGSVTWLGIGQASQVLDDVTVQTLKSTTQAGCKKAFNGCTVSTGLQVK